MTSFVLVHGGAHAAWCWERLMPHLAAGPHVEHVVAVDLCGHGDRLDAKPQNEISIADYVDDVVRAVEASDLHDVILVGHSLAGLTIAHAAVRLPGRIRRVVHLSTSVPSPGTSVNELMTHPLSPLNRGVDFQTMFCNDLDPESTEWLLSNLGPEPPGPMAEAMEPLACGIDAPVTYVVLERDEALPPDFQRIQAATAEAGEIVTFDAGHSAFVSRPRDLAELLLRYA